MIAASVLLGAFLAGTSPAATAPAAPVRPSVLLITLDTTRADHLGCYGATDASTPALDALAADGVRFERAFSPAPLTLPAHVSILSGRVPRRHGVRDNALFRLDPKIPLLQEALAAARYTTAAFVSAAVLDRELGLDRGFAIYDDEVRADARGGDAERTADRTVDAALARLAGMNGPFFLWVHLYDPHAPYAPPEPYATRFAGRPYDGEIAFMDAQIGRLVAAARAKASNLIVVAAGDHGESLGEHGEDGHGVFVYQATQHVPLIVSAPGLARGRVVADNVGLIDIAPTLAELAGVKPIPGPDGRSLAAALRQPVPLAARDYEMESYFPLFSYGWAPLRALVRARLKFVDAPRPELYDLGSDPGESANVRAARGKDAGTISKALFALIEGDMPAPQAMDPALAEHARRIASLGYVGGSNAADVGEVIDPKEGIAWIGALQEGRAALRGGDPAGGIPGLEKLVAKNPANLPALMTLGACYQAAGRVDDAIKIHRRALSLYPKSDLTWFNLAGALAEKGRSDPAALAEATKAYERSLAINPRHAEAGRAYAELLARAGALALSRKDRAGAKDAFDRALAADPVNPDALSGAAQVAFESGHFKTAALRFEALLEVTPTAAAARALGDIRGQKLHDPEGARAAYRKALALTRPSDPSYRELEKLAGGARVD